MNAKRNDWFMLKDYKTFGNSLESFKEEANKLDRGTFIEKVPIETVYALFCYSQTSNNVKITSRCQILYEGSVYPASMGGFERVENAILETRIDENLLYQKLLKELDENFLLNFEGDIMSTQKNFFVDDCAVKTLAAKLNIKMSYFQKDNFLKAILITSGLQDLDDITIVYRSDGHYNRIIAFVGDRYSRTPLYQVVKIAEKGSKYFTFDSWSISNNETYVNMRYKEFIIQAKVSDTCDFADSVDVYWNSPNGLYRLSSVAMADIDNYDSFFENLINELDLSDIKKNINDKTLGTVITGALGAKMSKIALNYINSKNNDFSAIVEIPDLLELSEYQNTKYHDIFYLMRNNTCK